MARSKLLRELLLMPFMLGAGDLNDAAAAAAVSGAVAAEFFLLPLPPLQPPGEAA